MPPHSSALLNRTLQRTALFRGTASMPHRASSTTRPTFTYHLAASASAKTAPSRAPKPNRDTFTYPSSTPRPFPPYLRSAKRDAGEDAFFAATVGGSPHSVAFGVADGVGGWQDSGVDPSKFSHGLCGLMAGTAHLHGQEGDAVVGEKGLGGGGEEGASKVPTLRPEALLQTAYDAVMGNPRILAGGCTASLALADAHGNLEAANLGDSGFLLLSPGKVTYRSDAQTHAFNTPFQLSKVPAKMQAQHAIFGGSSHFSETPAQADVSRHQVRHGDVVLFATDGVWDNLSAQDVMGVVTEVMVARGYWLRGGQGKGDKGAGTRVDAKRVGELPTELKGESEQAEYLPGMVAGAVMREAKVAGLDRRRDGPFAREVKMYYPQEGWTGGKPDDIAVVVCVAVEEGAGGEEEKPLKAKL